MYSGTVIGVGVEIERKFSFIRLQKISSSFSLKVGPFDYIEWLLEVKIFSNYPGSFMQKRTKLSYFDNLAGIFC